ncbi:uncharacterized protein LOC143256217 [Tachypleus tridentatus]|uniref:uncharacterized protein LOC143256217 n=1 Tax=Tachypleus tridentatus TaxID=6853 RepID=UPI003FD2B6E7
MFKVCYSSSHRDMSGLGTFYPIVIYQKSAYPNDVKTVPRFVIVRRTIKVMTHYPRMPPRVVSEALNTLRTIDCKLHKASGCVLDGRENRHRMKCHRVGGAVTCNNGVSEHIAVTALNLGLGERFIDNVGDF